jgi:nucleotide-binding universal stress UspA family protein
VADRSTGKFRSVVAAVDLSTRTARVIARAARLPWEEGGRLTLLHVLPKLLSASARSRAQARARRELEILARKVARELPVRVDLRTRVERGSIAATVGRTAVSSHAELVMVGRRASTGILSSVIGSTAERVVRHSARPVLLVRQAARHPYQRPVLAVDRDDAADAAIRAALRVLSPPRPPITLVHAHVVPYESLMNSNLSRKEMNRYRAGWRERATQDAQDLLARARAHSKSAGEDSVVWSPKVVQGTARIVIRKTVIRSRADLLVMGTHARRGPAYAFLGTVSGDVLRLVSCDVLLAPPPGRRPSR